MLRASLRVDPARPRVRYDPMLFGHFVEHFHRQVYGGIFDPGSELSDERGFRLDVIEAMRELRAPVVRWPGGCFVSAYHWLDGVGPQRRPAYDKAWRGGGPPTLPSPHVRAGGPGGGGAALPLPHPGARAPGAAGRRG